MKRYRVQVGYNGSRFHGWQMQPGMRTVQGVLKELLGRLGEGSTPYGAGRTDAGVHALANEAHIDLERSWKPAELERALRSLAPEDMGIGAVREVTADFHARFTATARRYAYAFTHTPTAFNKRLALDRRSLPSADWIRGEMACLEHHQDFASLCLSGSDVATTRCTVQDWQWWSFPKGAMLTVQADRFLYGMVRALVGTLLEGHDRGETGYLDHVLKARSRSEAGPSAPPWGLYFVRAQYPGDPPLKSTWHLDLASQVGLLAFDDGSFRGQERESP